MFFKDGERNEWYDKKTQTYIIKKDRELEKKGKIKLPVTL